MEPWFDERTAGIIGGVLGGVIGIWGGCILGGMSFFYIKKGLKKLAYCLYGITFFAGLVILGVGLVALIMKQPYHVWYPFILCGAITAIVPGAVFPVIRKGFAERENQIMAVEDL